MTNSTNPNPSALAKFTYVHRVCYSDTDAAGFVYHGRYLEIFERSRAEWLAQRDQSPTKLMNEFNIVMPVRELTMNFYKPGRLDDLLHIDQVIEHLVGISHAVETALAGIQFHPVILVSLHGQPLRAFAHGLVSRLARLAVANDAPVNLGDGHDFRAGAGGGRVFRQSDRELLSVDDCGDRCSGGLCCAL